MSDKRLLRLEEIVGQPKAIHVLSKALHSGHLPHVYLFVGPEGVGKETTALALFFKLICREGIACGKCKACRKFIRGVHPDVEIIRPSGKSIKIDQIRTLESNLHFAPLESARRLILITEADLLTREAANSLLKSLEEPPLYTLFVLLAPSPDALLPTIVSRSQIVRFRPIPPELISKVLVEQFEKLPEEALGLSVLSQGSIGRALRLSEKGLLEELSRFVRVIQSEDPASLISLAEILGGLKQDLEILLEMILVWLRQSLMASLGLEDYPLTFPSKAPYEMVLSAMELVEDVIRSLKYNVNRELAMLALLIRLRKLWHMAEQSEVSTKCASTA